MSSLIAAWSKALVDFRHFHPTVLKCTRVCGTRRGGKDCREGISFYPHRFIEAEARHTLQNHVGKGKRPRAVRRQRA